MGYYLGKQVIFRIDDKKEPHLRMRFSFLFGSLFNNFFLGLTLLRAFAVPARMPFLCLVAKKWRKKRRPAVPSGASPPSAVLKKERRKSKVHQASPHLGRISARPRWVSMARSFIFYGKNFACKILHKRANEHPTSIELDARVAFPFCLKLRRSQGKRQELSLFAKAKSEQLLCRCFSLKHRRKI